MLLSKSISLFTFFAYKSLWLSLKHFIIAADVGISFCHPGVLILGQALSKTQKYKEF